MAVSVSIGGEIASDDDTIKSLFETADRYMYRAKTSGKNRIITGIGSDVMG